ncbi:MAG: hypothetical protein WBY75_12370 [Terracidiphilus sp.]
MPRSRGFLRSRPSCLQRQALYALFADDTSQRPHEFGIRSALGAGSRDVALLPFVP